MIGCSIAIDWYDMYVFLVGARFEPCRDTALQLAVAAIPLGYAATETFHETSQLAYAPLVHTAR